jgi:NCS1 family nucleobase:cation symporter-1
MPRYLTIQRGALISLAIALAICPWHFASSNSNFATYLSAYSVLLAPFIGVILGDYYILRRGNLSIPDLYTMGKEGAYWYTSGINFRAFVAYIAGLLMNIVGFAGAVGANVSITATHIYTLAPFTGSLIALVVYLAICWYWPPVGAVDLRKKGWLEPKGGYEADDWSNPTGKAHDPESAEVKDMYGETIVEEDKVSKQEVSSVDY